MRSLANANEDMEGLLELEEYCLYCYKTKNIDICHT